MSFPRSPLDLVGEMYLGPSLGWVVITQDLRLSSATSGGGITITRSTQNGGQQPDAGETALVLNNPNGKYSPRNLRGPYYGLIGKNTPIRLGIRLAVDAFGRTVSNGWGPTTTGQPWTASGTASAYAVAGGLGTHAHPTINVLRRTTLDMALTDCELLITATSSAAVTGAALVTGFMFRIQPTGSYYWLRTEFDANSTDIILKITRVDHAGVFDELGILDPVPGLSYTAGTLITSRAAVIGQQLSIKAWRASDPEPFDWQLTVADSTIAAPGKPGIQTWVVAGNTNSPTLTASFDNFEVIDRRCYHELPDLPPRWDLSGKDRWVPAQAAGILRRLGQGTSPTQSALYRSYLNAGAFAWWSMEELDQAEAAASGIEGQPPMSPSGVDPFAGGLYPGRVAFGVDAGASGAASLVGLGGGGYLNAPIPSSSAGSWRFDISARLLAGTYGGSAVIPITWFGGTAPSGRPYEFDLVFTDTHARFTAGDPAGGGSTVTLDWTADPYDSTLHLYSIEMYRSGADVWVYFYRDGIIGDSVVWSGMTLPVLSGVTLGYYGMSGPDLPAVAHCAVFAPAQESNGSPQALAVRGNVGETAAARFARLCDEEGVPVSIWGDPAQSAPMGLQKPATFLELLKECSEADLGPYYEARDRIGLLYRVHRSLYNQTPIALDYSAGHIAGTLDTVDDDQQVKNDWSITRTGGSTFRAVQETGPLSIQRPPDGVGRYEQSRTVNVRVDEQARKLTGWQRHRYTWDEPRFPHIKVNLATAAYVASPDLAAQVAALDPGGLLSIVSPPVDLPQDGIDQIVQGTVEFLDAYDRTITFNTVPGGPYRIATVAGTQRLTAVNSTLTVAIDDDDLTASVASQAGTLLWRTGNTSTRPDRFPLRVRLGGGPKTGGEVAVVSGISGGTSPQTFTFLSRGVLARAWAAGTTVQVADPVTLAI